MIKFASVLNPKIAYCLSGEWDYNKRGNAPLSRYLNVYETYGDGLTQHSGSWAAQLPALTDACLSLTSAVVADPSNPEWHQLSYIFPVWGDDLITFALSIRCQEGKTRYYNLADRKLSTTDSKRHDKRWEKVESWMDGSPCACLAVLLHCFAHYDWLAKIALADDLRRLSGYPLWEELLSPVKDLPGDWHQAFSSTRSVVRAIAGLDYAKRAAQTALSNSKPQVETVAA